MKTFKQARDVLEDAKKFHQDMADYYTDLQDTTEDARTRLLLDHMIEFETRLANNLKNYGSVAPEKFMNTWLQYTQEENAIDFLRKQELGEKPGIKDINRLSREVDNYFSELYKEVYALIESQEAKEVFDNLKQIQDKERITLSMATNSLWDM
ncbi:hypothetical protein [Biformimicrobium ophioploci]|uniref:DUF2383 domain-containing protein n=1 Tax=Biformimicrobium ophioploci TaxID=3036711 RepID=A0ABQ6LXA3_9GAMM|nr:hypothetical protein [Microbulbifer sp. NKW57]GMG86675.1 hypothetical protein MNKW57_09960 [Microbulbifer sp. NKW57]